VTRSLKPAPTRETTLGGIGPSPGGARADRTGAADADTTPTNSAADDRAKLTNLGRTTVGADLDGPAQVIIGQAAGAAVGQLRRCWAAALGNPRR
jgi:hypothetical protein